jgi:outer membrane biosynthesis protein TonB
MIAHKARLYYLKNRYTILLTFVAFILLTTLFLQVILLRQALHQSEDNEDTLKGISCILLIKPDERTQEKINACIDANSGTKPEDQGFKFNPNKPDGDDDPEETKPIVNNNEVVLPAPLPSEQPIIVDKPSNPPKEDDQESPIQPIVREIETKVNDITGELQCRVVGETFWREGNNCK